MNKKSLPKIIGTLALIGASIPIAKKAYEIDRIMRTDFTPVLTAGSDAYKEAFVRISTEYRKAYMNQSLEFADYDIPQSQYFESADSSN